MPGLGGERRAPAPLETRGAGLDWQPERPARPRKPRIAPAPSADSRRCAEWRFWQLFGEACDGRSGRGGARAILVSQDVPRRQAARAGLPSNGAIRVVCHEHLLIQCRVRPTVKVPIKPRARWTRPARGPFRYHGDNTLSTSRSRDECFFPRPPRRLALEPNTWPKSARRRSRSRPSRERRSSRGGARPPRRDSGRPRDADSGYHRHEHQLAGPRHPTRLDALSSHAFARSIA